MRLLCVLLLLGLAGPAVALSCLRPDVVRDYRAAAESDDLWIVVEGTLTFDETRLPQPDMGDQHNTLPETDIPARIEGRSLGASGFKRRFDAPITLRALCFGPWCGGAQSGTSYLAFLRKEGDGYIAFADPCGTRLHANPSRAMSAQVVTCFNGGPCTAKPGRR